MRYVVIDVETPNRKNDRISEFGFAIVEDGRIPGWDEIRCNPETHFDSFNSRLTGIKKEDVKNCFKFPELWEKVYPYIRDSVIVAHGATFDLNVLHKCFQAYNMVEPSFCYCCTEQMSMRMWPELKHYGLDVLCGKLGIALDHHHAGSDAVATAQILLTLLDAGYDVERDITNFVPADQKQKLFSFFDGYTTPHTASINDLIALLDNISADGEISMDELLKLGKWLVAHEELSDKREFRAVVDLLNHILADGTMDQKEQSELLTLCHQLVDPVAVGAPVQDITLEGSIVCLTGEFAHGSREEIEQLLKERGATISASVVKKLTYLFVGGLGSELWSTANYGSKVKKALAWQEKGANIKIVREEDLFTSIGNMA